VEIYTGSTSTRSMWRYIQEIPVPDQSEAIYREYQYQINNLYYIPVNVDGGVPSFSCSPPSAPWSY
jgi:hypothetical protein